MRITLTSGLTGGVYTIFFLKSLARFLLRLRIDGYYNYYNNARSEFKMQMDIELLESTDVGGKYRVSRELGKELYQLTEEDLAIPN
ncbi:uncharacterized protein N7525_007509 [Penicillium rubens]|uniref:uncharacterized protein n=1 Tax=Penicillium rubens TaxID=1108849 RepID=UPI002A5AB197|nr:uncharacterized protein N7525_007509 [Penicillium rubens]KAJ5829256.1 hypothetical protein N7525_007509 [Penicillium rubens]KAJ5841184.1 hypothetical protein N7534_011014 [Penicillium rubens]